MQGSTNLRDTTGMNIFTYLCPITLENVLSLHIAEEELISLAPLVSLLKLSYLVPESPGSKG